MTRVQNKQFLDNSNGIEFDEILHVHTSIINGIQIFFSLNLIKDDCSALTTTELTQNTRTLLLKINYGNSINGSQVCVIYPSLIRCNFVHAHEKKKSCQRLTHCIRYEMVRCCYEDNNVSRFNIIA